MVSEIKGTGTSAAPRVDAGVRRSDTPGKAGNASGPTEVVTLTDLAARLQQLSDAVRDLPVVDQARVAEFREAVESGDYRLNERQIAEKLASFEAMLGRR